MHATALSVKMDFFFNLSITTNEAFCFETDNVTDGAIVQFLGSEAEVQIVNIRTNRKQFGKGRCHYHDKYATMKLDQSKG